MTIQNIDAPIIGLIIQIGVILLFSRVCAHVLKFFGQPQVVGEMMAGILLGKSVFAYLWPEGFELIFPESSMSQIFILSQLGLIFFMFVVGLNLKTSELKSRGTAAVLISHSSIVFPFALGIALAFGLFPSYGPKNIEFLPFALFIGIAMSITAFPVLARIIEEKKLTETPLGALALTCAAIDDVTAWCILAAVVGVAKAGGMTSALVVLVAAFIFVISIFKLVRPAVERILKSATDQGELTRNHLSFVFCVLLGSALVSEFIGIHAFFGAFLAGVIMPRSLPFRATLLNKIEDLVSVLLLPLFFAYTGLRTQISLLNSVDSIVICLGIICLAVLGKFFGSAIAARWTGMNWKDSFALGSLMNTRGLMELVVLNIGYDLGILSPVLFAMFVIMAIATTVMTTPLLSLFLCSKGQRNS